MILYIFSFYSPDPKEAVLAIIRDKTLASALNQSLISVASDKARPRAEAVVTPSP